MRTIYNIIWVVLLFGGAVLLGLSYNPLQISNQARRAVPHTLNRGELKRLYDVSFIMEKAPSGNIVSYLPRLGFSELGQQRELAALWGFTGDYHESESRYSYYNEDGVLDIDKFGDHVKFTSALAPGNRLEITSETAVGIAEEFMLRRLGAAGELASVSLDNRVYEVILTERLGNLRNYGFPNTVRIDGLGNVLSAECYFLTYDKLDSFPIKSMAEAYYDLPADIEAPVDLKGCTLVYYYLNSILQPCYLFEGDYADGGGFQVFLPATVYR